MYNSKAPMITLTEIQEARKLLEKSPYFIRTPTLSSAEKLLKIKNVELHLKLENMQVSGSFKSRGLINQLSNLPEKVGTPQRKLVSLSAGNYGKAFAMLSQEFGLSAKVLMPDTAPENRRKTIEKFGATVETFPTPELMAAIDRHVREEQMFFLHSFDDTKLMAAYGSIGLEVLEDVPDPDVVVVCCGGGGLLSGIAAAIKLSGNTQCRVYGVEPEQSRTMHESFRTGSAATMEVGSVASGLSPPNAGPNAYRHCLAYVDDILLVSESELVSAMFHLYDRRILAEASGAAAFAALLYNKVPDVANKRVVVVITGGNVSPTELCHLRQKFSVDL